MMNRYRALEFETVECSFMPIFFKNDTITRKRSGKKLSSGHAVTASSLIVVSNRLPFVLKRKPDDSLERHSSAGGLVTAVAPVVVQSGGLWVGWPGIAIGPQDLIPESDPSDVSPTAGLKSSQVYSVNLDSDDYELYYNGCCNATFWPLFHSMPDRAIFNEKFWLAYRKVNEHFAEITMNALRKMLAEHPEQVPLIWIHDYHLMLAANTIRQMADEENLSCKLGFFLHIPFPPWDIVKIFPWEDMILQGILGCDLIGFHIEDYCLNFLDSCQRGLGCRVDRRAMLVEHGGRTVRIRPLPIGIPFNRFEQLAKEAAENMFDKGLKVILGVDRLDYTKGLTNRLLALERLLEEHPEHIEKILFLQVAVPSRTDVKEYVDLKEEMDKLVGMINGKFSTPHWSPIRYIFGCISQQELAGFYRDADVALVTPMRDGMNLVAKEFAACRINEPGVLILSPFAGAGGMMHEALLVNPYEIGNVANVLHRALTMPLEEREVRMHALRAREKIHDVNYWMRSFLKSIGTLIAEDGEDVLPTQMQPVGFEDFDSYLSSYVGDRAILSLLLDYDGTLAPICSHPDLAVIPVETKKVLERLSNNPDVFIAIISGRSVANVKEMVGIDGGITYAGNHGLEILHPDGTKFVHPMPESQQSRIENLLKSLQEEVCRDGAWIENKGVLLTYHYRDVPADKREELVPRAKHIISEAGFKVGLAHCALECKPYITWDKGRASIYILRTAFGVDWSERIRIIFAGDDVTDEDAISALKGMAFTFRIVSDHLTKTSADKRLPSTDSVLTLLKWVEKHMSTRRRKPLSKPVILSSSNPDNASHSVVQFHNPTTSIVHIPGATAED